MNQNQTEDPTKTRVVYTISELNQMVRSLLEDAFPPLWVEGEISNFSCPSSGHWYFSLKDSAAQVRAAMFAGRNRSLGFQPENGKKVLVRAKISLYEARGEFQLIADFMEEAGDGALRRAFEILKAKLAEEGLFAAERKKPLPAMPRCIGLITSATGAAVHDILTVLKRRFPNLPVIIYPTLVQGKLAAPQIVRALQLANLRNECDVLIVTRGGGSLEDLWPFNEEAVARAIDASTIPIISAVGHEIDFTIADFVADIRAPTPSAAAAMVSPNQAEWQNNLIKIYQALIQSIRHKLLQTQTTLTALAKRLRHPGERLREHAQRLDELENNLKRVMRFRLEQYQQRLMNLSRALDAVSPLATLARGYAIVSSQESGKVIYKSSEVIVNDKVVARLGEGSLVCTVDEIHK